MAPFNPPLVQMSFHSPTSQPKSLFEFERTCRLGWHITPRLSGWQSGWGRPSHVPPPPTHVGGGKLALLLLIQLLRAAVQHHHCVDLGPPPPAPPCDSASPPPPGVQRMKGIPWDVASPPTTHHPHPEGFPPHTPSTPPPCRVGNQEKLPIDSTGSGSCLTNRSVMQCISEDGHTNHGRWVALHDPIVCSQVCSMC